MLVNNTRHINYFKSLQTCWVKSKIVKKTPVYIIWMFLFLRIKPCNVSQAILSPKGKQLVFFPPFFLKPKKLKCFNKKKPNNFLYRFV